MGYVIRDPEMEVSGDLLSYCCDAFKQFGAEFYRTWRWELFTSLLIAAAAYGITIYDDPQAWKNLMVTLEASGYVLGGFSIWHLIRTPFLVHQKTVERQRVPDHWGFGVLGIVALIFLGWSIYHTGRTIMRHLRPVVVMTVPSADQCAHNGQAALIKNLEDALADTKKAPAATNGENPNPRPDMLCRNLGDCPSKELARRGIQKADEIDGIINTFELGMNDVISAARNHERDHHLSPGSPEFDQEQQNAHDSIRALAAVSVGQYRKIQVDVLAMRQALMDRVGEHDVSKDMYYNFAALNTQGDYMLKEVSTDLRGMSAKLLAMQQQH